LRAVLLDAMGTLIKLDPPAARLRKELARRFGIAVEETVAQRAIATEIAYYRRHLDEGRDSSSLASLRRRCAEIVGQEVARATGAALPGADEMTDALLASLHFSRFADVPEALAELRRRGLRLVVVSNWDISLPAVLERLGVSGLVDGVVTSAQAGARKPAAGIFTQALSVAGTDPAEAWHVGDSLDEDVVGARAAGIEPIFIHRCAARVPEGVQLPEGVPVIASLHELTDLLDGPAPGAQ